MMKTPNSEIRIPNQTQIPNPECGLLRKAVRILSFGFLSDFAIRISDFKLAAFNNGYK